MNEQINRPSKRISDRLVDFIDIIFAVVVGTSLTVVFEGTSFHTLPALNELITLPAMSLAIAYIAVVMSWVGYHKMIEFNPYELNRWGHGRFMIDFAIVFVYTAQIYSRENHSMFLCMFPLTFLLYAIGGILRSKEYGKGVSWPKGSLLYVGVFGSICIFYEVWNFFEKDIQILESIPIEWIILPLALICLIIYRWQREKKGFKEKVIVRGD